MESFELLEDDTRLVPYIQDLPYQEGKPLSPIAEGEEANMVLIDYSTTSGECSPYRHIYMASIRDEDEPRREYDDELLEDISADENTANAPRDEDEESRRIRQAKNAKRAKRKRNAEARLQNAPRRNLHDAFAAAADRQYATPIANIAKAAILLQRLPQNPKTVRVLQLAQHALIQLDQRDPMPSVHCSRSRSERHESSAPQNSRTLGGRRNP
jgi:hypothetical protein